MEVKQLYELFKRSNGVTTDTRKIGEGQLFFALKGGNFNGNEFAVQAIENGASYSIIDEAHYKLNDRCILVDNVLDTLQQLAHYHRIQVNPKAIIAVTGSNGKTTTKELLHAVLSTTFRTHYTKGNLNNHIGIPITLLDMKADTEIAVIEMGANHRQEIAGYCRYVEPTHGVITNCGKAHLEGFGGVEGIRKGKGELYDYLKNNKGVIFVNEDDDILLMMLQERNIDRYISYGNSSKASCKSTILKDHPFLEIQFEDVRIHSNLFGSYNYSNIMCAVAVATYFGVSTENIRTAIGNYFPENARSQLIQQNGYQLIMDSYNANPTSMQHALESFSKGGLAHKVIILGDMYELGEESEKEHQFIADLCVSLHFETIVLVGKNFGKTNTPDSVIKFENAAEAQVWFRKQDLTNAQILLKGSRSMGMEKVVA